MTIGQTIGIDETVELFEQLGDFLQDNDIEMETDGDFPQRYTHAMNRLRYLQKREKGIKAKKTSKRYGGYFITCGNCGSGIDAHYRFCPHCGYLIDWKEADHEPE